MSGLDMRNQQCSVACAQGFVRCCFKFPKLSQIFWSSGKLIALVCAVLSQARLPKLRDLHLSDQGLDAAGLPELLQASWRRLTTPDLANNNVDLVAVAALSQSSWYKKLQRLCLSGSALGEEGSRALGLGQWDALNRCNHQWLWYQQPC